METGIADDAALLNEPSDARAAAAVAAWAALGIDDVRIFVQWQAIAPGQLGRQGARRLRLRRSEQPGL